MLRIKDDVDIKELEKFGFVYSPRYRYYRNNNEKGTIDYVFEQSRNIVTNVDKYPDDYKIHDTIYDIFQAGLVEKVEDAKNEENAS